MRQYRYLCTCTLGHLGHWMIHPWLPSEIRRMTVPFQRDLKWSIMTHYEARCNLFHATNSTC